MACLLALVVGLLAAECLVRAAGQRVLPLPQVRGSLQQDIDHPLLLFVNKANATKVVTYDDGPEKQWSVTMRTNSQCFRGPSVEQEKAEGVYRIACLGDSHTWGFGVEAKQTWPAHLQQYADPDVEVLNFGVNGYDTLQEVLWFESHVEAFDPDLVLLAYFANDAAARGLAGGVGKKKRDRLTEWTHPHRSGWIKRLRRGSVAFDLFCDGIYRSRSLSNRQESWDLCYSDSHPGWQRSRDALIRLRNRCKRDGRELRVILFPYLVAADDVFESHAALGIVADFCRQNQIQCFDGEPPLLATLGPAGAGALRVSQSDFHASGEAYSALADFVASGLAAAELPFRGAD